MDANIKENSRLLFELEYILLQKNFGNKHYDCHTSACISYRLRTVHKFMMACRNSITDVIRCPWRISREYSADIRLLHPPFSGLKFLLGPLLRWRRVEWVHASCLFILSRTFFFSILLFHSRKEKKEMKVKFYSRKTRQKFSPTQKKKKH